ncbi:MAG TPA: PadR family transcriptional regulator [Spirochaetes bacterium]|nr:PadR family transcriptional regulator [Spirochaetota bacterium]
MSIKHAILGLLHYKDMHGYSIKEHIEKHFGNMWTVNYGQIYPSLESLEEDGHITMVELAPSEDGGPHKKLYSITPEGRAEFGRWLESSPERQMFLRDPFLMRFIFFGFGDRDSALRIIDEQIAFYREQMERREENIPRWENYGVYVRLMAEMGLNLNKTYLDWLIRAREEIERCGDEEPAWRRAVVTG